MPPPSGKPTRAAALASSAVLAGAVLAPVFFNPWSKRMFEPDKHAFIQGLALLAAAGLATAGAWRRVPLLAPVLAVLGSAAVSALYSVVPHDSWWGSYDRGEGVVSLAAGAMIFLAMALAPPDRALLLRAVVAASLPATLYALLQKAGVDPIWGTELSRRVAGTMGNPVLLGAWLIMAMPLTAARLAAAWRESRLEAAVCGLALALQGLVLFWTGARGPMLGLLAGGSLAVLALGTAFREPARGPVPLADAARALGLPLFASFLGFGLSRLALRLAGVVGPYQTLVPALLAALAALGALAWVTARDRRWLPLTWAVSLGVGAGLLLVLNLPASSLERLQQAPLVGGAFRAVASWRTLPALGRVSGLAEAGSRTGQVRLLLWGGTMDLLTTPEPLRDASGEPDPWFSLRPWLGYGPETLSVTFLTFHPPALAEVEKRTSTADRAHNDTLDRLAFTGLLGLAAWQWLYGAGVLLALRRLGLVGSGGTLRFAVLWVAGGLGAAGLAGSTVGLPYAAPALAAGNLAGVLAFLALASPPAAPPSGAALSAALLAAVTGHLLEIQFGFTVAASGFYLFLALGWLCAPPPEGAPVEDPGTASLVLGLVLACLAWAFGQPQAPPAPVLAACLAAWILGAALFPHPGKVLLGSGAAGVLALALDQAWLRALDGAPNDTWLRLFPLGMAGLALFLAATVLALACLHPGGAPPGTADRCAPPARAWASPAPLLAAGLALALAAPLVGTLQADMVYRRSDVLGKLRQEGAREASLETLREAVRRWPEQLAWQLALARDLGDRAMATGDRTKREALLEEAARHLDQAGRVNPYHPGVPAGRGDIAVRRARTAKGEERERHLEEARRLFAAAIARSPANVLMRNRAARSLLEAGGTAQEAVAALQESLRVDASLADTWFELATALQVAALRETDPVRRQEWLARAAEALLAGAGRLANQLEASRRQVQAARLLGAAGRREEAARAWEAAEAAADPQLLSWRGLAEGAGVYGRAGRLDEARQRAARALQAAPEKERAELQRRLGPLLGAPP